MSNMGQRRSSNRDRSHREFIIRQRARQKQFSFQSHAHPRYVKIESHMMLCLACGQSLRLDSPGCPACGFSPAIENGIPLFAPELSKFNAGFDKALFAQLAEIEAGNFWHRARNQLIVWAL